MFRRGENEKSDHPSSRMAEHNSMLLVWLGTVVEELLSGFFEIGGGFLIVPALVLATGMPMIYAVGTFDLTKANSYEL